MPPAAPGEAGHRGAAGPRLAGGRRDLADRTGRARARTSRGRRPVMWSRGDSSRCSSRTRDSRPLWPAPTGLPTGRTTGPEITLGPATFDTATGRLRRLGDLEVAGPRLELWRAPTDNDRSDTRGSFELAGPEDTAGEGAPGPSSAQRWRERGLDRLTHRVLELRHDRDQLLVRVRVSAAGGARFVDVSYRWWLADGLALRVELTPSAGWDCTWPRVGVRLDLPANLTRAQLVRHGPAGVLSRQPVGGPRRGLLGADRRTGGEVLPAAGDRAPERSCAGWRSRTTSGYASGSRRRRTRPDTGRASPSAGTPRSSSTGPRTRTSSGRASTSTCSSTMRCTASARGPAGSTCCRSTRSGRARGRSSSGCGASRAAVLEGC